MTMFVLVCGCGTVNHDPLTARELSSECLVVVLPGIEGLSLVNCSIRRGLVEGGVRGTVHVEEWGCKVPLLKMLVNQTNPAQARSEACSIAQMIEAHRRKNRALPVFLVGDSGGGGVAVFILEALADMHAPPIEAAILLSPSMSADYDLTKAINQTRRGIVCFFNPDDTGLLGAGTTIFGNVDGGHGDSAGRVSFVQYDQPQRRKLAYDRLQQVIVTFGDPGNVLPHLAATDPIYVALHVAPWINEPKWPVTVPP